QAWASRPEVYEVTVQGRVIGLAPSPDGSWAAPNVTPGPYLLHLGTHANSTPSPIPPVLYRAQILVPEGDPAEPVDLGEVAVATPE
ncbi:MAG: hypothetical protein IT580_06075, partial [Verrucomicrobiales bacterium]|nr:hypothetical protein [Verrucomicrobiales bacterium]